MMLWGTLDLDPSQRELICESLEFARRHADGLPQELLDNLASLLSMSCIKLRVMKHRARLVKLPGLLPKIELNPEALGLLSVYDHRRALAMLPQDSQDSQERERQEASIMAKAEQQWLFIAAALVHEGTHALEGVTLRRDQDERQAYRAELRFLANVYHAVEHPLIRNAAKNLHDDAIRDARCQERVDLQPIL